MAESQTRSHAQMQAERQKHEAATQARRAKNNETLSALKLENEKLHAELALLTVPGAGSTIAKLEEQDRLAQMKLEIESLERRIGHEKNLGNDFDKSTAVVRVETLRIRQSMRGNNSASDRVGAVDKQIRLLENRLDQALVDFNKALAVNRSLRQRIDNLRGERQVFKEIYDKLEAALHGRKRAMALLIERSNEDYEQCDKAQQDLVNLQAVVADDRQRYTDESRKLEDLMTRYKGAREQQQHQLIQEKARVAAEQAKKRAAKSLKGNRRMLLALTQGSLGGTSGSHGSGGQNGELGSPHGRRGGAAGGGISPSSDREAAAVAEDDPNQLQDVIEKLKDGTGVQDLDLLYQTFVRAEESNFSSFNFVNELNSERDDLDASIAKLREELTSRRSETERHATLKALETELARTEQSNEATQKRCEALKDLLGQVRVVAERIFNKISCSHEEATELLGTSQCTELNMTRFFGMIENRTNVFLFAYQQANQNELLRRSGAKEEETRKKRERRLAAGGAADDGEGDEATTTVSETALQQANAAAASGAPKRMNPPNLGPSNPSGTVIFEFSRDQLPSCNPGAESALGDDKLLEENVPLDPAQMRVQLAEKLEKRHRDEQAGKRQGTRRRKNN